MRLGTQSVEALADGAAGDPSAVRLVREIYRAGPLVLWAFLPSGDNPALRVHRLFRRQVWRDAGPLAWIGFALGFLGWIPMQLGLCIYGLATSGAKVKRDGGKGLVRQAIEQLGLAARYGIPPLYYYELGFHDDRRRANALFISTASSSSGPASTAFCAATIPRRNQPRPCPTRPRSRCGARTTGFPWSAF